MLSFTACANPTFTWSPLATVTISSVVPTTLNLIPPALFNCCVAVVVLSPPNWIVFVANSLNWEPFIASFDVALIVPGATFVIFLSPALIPVLSITTSFVPGVAPGIVIFLVVTESKSFRSLFNL